MGKYLKKKLTSGYNYDQDTTVKQKKKDVLGDTGMNLINLQKSQ